MQFLYQTLTLRQSSITITITYDYRKCEWYLRKRRISHLCINFVFRHPSPFLPGRSISEAHYFTLTEDDALHNTNANLLNRQANKCAFNSPSCTALSHQQSTNTTQHTHRDRVIHVSCCTHTVTDSNAHTHTHPVGEKCMCMESSLI